MKRALLSMIVFAGVLAAQPFGPGAVGPGANFGGEHRAMGQRGQRGAALAEALGMEPDEFASRMAELRVQIKAQREAMKADGEAIRALHEQLNAAKEAKNAEEIGNLVLTIDAKRAEIKAKAEQNRDAIVNTVKGWSPDAEAGLARLQEAAALVPALMQARALGLIEGPGGGDRGRNKGHQFGGRKGPGGPPPAE